MIDNNDVRASHVKLLQGKSLFCDTDLLNLAFNASAKLLELKIKLSEIPDAEFKEAISNHFIQCEMKNSVSIQDDCFPVCTFFREGVPLSPSDRLIELLDNMKDGNTRIDNEYFKNITKVYTNDFFPRNTEQLYTQNGYFVGCGVEDGYLSAPAPRFVPHLVEDILQYINTTALDEDEELYISFVVAVGMIHAQIRAVSPFENGNGTLARVILLQMLRNYLGYPVIAMSQYFNNNRSGYYDRLSEYQKTGGESEEWLRYFLIGLANCCKKSLSIINDTYETHKKTLRLLPIWSSSGTIKKIYYYALSHPEFTINNAANDLDISFSSANLMVERLREVRLLELKNPERKRGRVYCYRKMSELFVSENRK